MLQCLRSSEYATCFSIVIPATMGKAMTIARMVALSSQEAEILQMVKMFR